MLIRLSVIGHARAAGCRYCRSKGRRRNRRPVPAAAHGLPGPALTEFMVPPARTAGSIVTFYSTGYLKPHVDGTHGPAGLRNTQRYGLPDPPRLSAIGLQRRIGIAIRDNSFSGFPEWVAASPSRFKNKFPFNKLIQIK